MGLSNFIVKVKCYWKDRIFYPGDVLEKHNVETGGLPPEHFEHTGGDPLPVKKEAAVPVAAPAPTPKPATPAPIFPIAKSAIPVVVPPVQPVKLADVGPSPAPAAAVAAAAAGQPVALSALAGTSPAPVETAPETVAASEAAQLLE